MAQCHSTSYLLPGKDSSNVNGFQIRYTNLQQLGLYADRVGSSDNKAPETVKQLVMASLATNRLIYCKAKTGDCGTPQKPSGTGAVGDILKFAPVGTSAALSIGALGHFGALAASTTLGTALGAATLGLGLIAIPFFAITAHHAQAVAMEQSTLCSVTNAWNGFADAVEQALTAGKAGLQDALVALKNTHDQLVGALGGIEKGMNAAFFFHKALDALQIWDKEIIFPSLVPGSTQSVPGQSGASTPGSFLPALAIGGVAAKVAFF